MQGENNAVGIIGYWFATNYGGVASYYSLYRTIEELGYDPFFVESPYFRTDQEGYDVFSRNFFREIRANISEGYEIPELEKLNEKADKFLLGSDQVLTKFAIKTYGKLFLMEFANETAKRIAISASCGGESLNLDDDLLHYARTQIQKFSKVSMREFSGADIMRDKMGIDAQFMMDPIFYTSKDEYKDIGARAGQDEQTAPYILAYILDPSEDKTMGIKKLAATLQMDVKVALDGRKNSHERNERAMNWPEVILPELNFKQWLYYYANASYVITDSFHGTAMSMILNKPYIAFANRQRGYPRFLSLIRLFSLKKRIVETSSEITDEMIGESADFDHINNVIAEQKQNALKWLADGLALKRNEQTSIILPQNSVISHLEKRKCVGCSACVNICPKMALHLEADQWGYYRAELDAKECIDCGMCLKVCPRIKLPQNENFFVPKCYEYVSNDRYVLDKSSSGGVFTAFATEIFENQGTIVGAAWRDDFSVEHIVVDDPGKLHLLQKSKYLQSYLGTIFRDIEQRLKDGQHVLFTGCPCQTAGLKAYLRAEYENLIAVDLLCGNVPSAKFFKEYLWEAFPEGIQEYEFRNKSRGYNCECVSVKFKDGTEKIIYGFKEDAFQRVFHNHTMCPPHCENCQFQKLPRFGDLTIGDFWGLSHYEKKINIKNGVSLVLCNSTKGEAFWNKIIEKQYGITKEVPLDWMGGNGYAIKGSHNYCSPKRDIFFEAIQRMDFSKAVNYALKPNHGIYESLYEDVNIQLMFNAKRTHFSFDPNIWEEHLVDGKPTLHVRTNQWKMHRYASLPLTKMLTKWMKYHFSIRFKLKSNSAIISFHIRDAGTGAIQIIHTFHNPKDNDGNRWYEVSKEFIPDAELYDQFMIGASQVSGIGNYISIDYINIKEISD